MGYDKGVKLREKLGPEEDYQLQQELMVETQLRSRGVRNARVLEAMRRVERHRFVPESERDRAYGDFPLGIGEGQTISQPYMVAVTIAALELKGEERILDVGAGSGYQTALLSLLAAEVYAVERIPTLAESAERTLKDLNYNNVTMVIGDGSAGLAAHAPYDGIAVAAGSPQVPKPLLEQLKDGGRLVIPVGNHLSQVLTVIHKRGGKFHTTKLDACRYVKLIGEYGW